MSLHSTDIIFRWKRWKPLRDIFWFQDASKVQWSSRRSCLCWWPLHLGYSATLAEEELRVCCCHPGLGMFADIVHHDVSLLVQESVFTVFREGNTSGVSTEQMTLPTKFIEPYISFTFIHSRKSRFLREGRTPVTHAPGTWRSQFPPHEEAPENKQRPNQLPDHNPCMHISATPWQPPAQVGKEVRAWATRRNA